MVEFEDVGLRYGQGPEVLKDIRFSLAPGSFHFLTGESGAGKTSLLSLMYLANSPTRGRLSLFDTDVNEENRKKFPEIRRNIGVVFQDFRLLDHLTAQENVALPLRVMGIKELEIKRHVNELLSWVGLEDHINAKPPTLAGGQKQRVAIARALINRPKLLLADEPTGNVDDRIATRLLRLFIELNKIGTTVVIATHNEGLIERFPFPRIHLSSGRLKILPSAKMSGIK
ncbi:MAG: cell division ATP-binding protein FtsE [Alphaproteobacteria bacterium]|nr:cell division ATP-binding protein FtsE [Alphaproteobacteria bacterium]